jgi:CheY-like chemotaxis protein
MEPKSRPPPRIFFIHDGSDVRHYVQHLEAAGLHVAAADGDGNPVEAVVAADPDIIVLDFEHDGETVRQLKEDPRTRSIPVIALAELAAISRTRGPEEGETS